MITIVDYGLGNIQAFVNVYKRLHIPVSVATTANELAGATRLILPGVGSFDQAMGRLNRSGMIEPLHELVREKNIPVLGVCVGMQMLAIGSDEGQMPGLSWIPGHVRSFRSIPGLSSLPQPHMGWNDVHPQAEHFLFRGLETDARFYFLHSYYFDCDSQENCCATSYYGAEFSSAVTSGNIFGVQFHPEKSHHCGVTLLKNFAEL